MRFSIPSTVFLFLLAIPNADAAIYTVDRTDDPDLAVVITADDCTAAPDDCSLRGAVSKAETDATEDEIVLPASATSYTLTRPQGGEGNTSGDLVIAGGDLDVTRPLKITGAGADQVTIDGSGIADDDRVFHVNMVVDTDVFEVSGVKITGGATGFRGGAIWVFGARLVLSDSNITGNTAVADGGGVSVDNGSGNSSITNTTISGNSADQRGGALFYETGSIVITNTTFSGNTAVGDGTNNTGGGAVDLTTGNMTLINTTFVGNTVTTAGSIGGGIRNNAGGASVLTIKNTLLAGNNVAGVSQNCALGAGGNVAVSQGGSISSDASCLASFLSGTDLNSIAGTIVSATLADNGGKTQTHTLPSGSQAIDLAVNCDASGGGALTTDQRGLKRPADGDGNGTATCDAGAVEVGCGNENVDSGEECDDGNVTNGDGCSSTCQTEAGGGGGTCGDNNVDAGEQCDDGNTLAGDGCSDTCTNEGTAACGDDILQAGEECDDGNTVDGDGCSATCDDEGGSGGCSLIRH